MQKLSLSLLFLLIACVLLAFALPLLPAVVDGDEFYGLSVTNDVPSLPLPVSDTEADLRVVFFGYRSCATVCPVQFGNMMQLQKRLQGLAVEFVFVTLDPERDTDQLLKETAEQLGPQFVTFRPQSTRAAQKLALAYGDTAARVQHRSGYDFDHSANLYVVTGRWQRQLIYARHDLNIDRVENDLRQLLAAR